MLLLPTVYSRRLGSLLDDDIDPEVYTPLALSQSINPIMKINVGALTELGLILSASQCTLMAGLHAKREGCLRVTSSEVNCF